MRLRSRSSSTPWFVLPALLATLAAAARPASAQTASDKATAQALFDDAQRLVAAQDWAGACPKYAESNRLDPGIGVKLYLADCLEHTGRTASAWAMFGEAEDYAARAGDNRAAVAKQRAQRLEPSLTRLVIAVTEPLGGLQVKRDGAEVGAAQWGIPLPVDPGAHLVEVTAPGKVPWSLSVDAKGPAATVRVDVPRLDDLPVQAPGAAQGAAGRPDGAPPPADEGSSWSTQKTLAVVSGGIGVVGLGLGAAFGVAAKSNLDDSNSGHCHDGNQCDATGVQLRSSAKNNALGSTVSFAVGGVGLAGGLVLWFLAPSRATVGVAPVVTDRFAGAMIDGAF